MYVKYNKLRRDNKGRDWSQLPWQLHKYLNDFDRASCTENTRSRDYMTGFRVAGGVFR